MRKFTNPKAIELFNEAQSIERHVASEIAEGKTLFPDRYAELMTEAAGLRVLADDVEDGVISDEELEGA